MTKEELLALERNAHLTPRELQRADPALAGPITARLEARARRAAVERISGGSAELRNVVANLDVRIGDRPENVTLRDAALEALRARVRADGRLAGDDRLRAEIDALGRDGAARAEAGAVEPDTNLADALALDEPLGMHPEFGAEIAAARVWRLADAARLPEDAAKVLVAEVGDVAALTEERLSALVEGRKLTGEQAAAAGKAASLHHLLDERPELVAAVAPGLGEVRDLVAKDEEDWTRIVKESGARPPGGLSAEAYGAVLAKKVEALFPTPALARRLGAVNLFQAFEAHRGLAALRERNPGVPVVGRGDFDGLARDGLGADEGTLRERYEATQRLVHRYPGLRLAEVLDDAARPEAERTNEVGRRVGLVNRFFAENPDLLEQDLTPRSAELATLLFPAGTADADRARVLATARAYQRAYAVTDDVADAAQVVAGGFPSAVALAAAREDVVLARSGLSPEKAKAYREKAVAIAAGVTAHVGTVLEVLSGGSGGVEVATASPEIQAYLKELPGYAEFFGSQDFCACRHCQSILGPAAYFVDLMRFVDQYVTQRHFTGKPAHPLRLQNRRPDLWALPLTCENTNTVVPYLTVIDEILENAIAREAGYAGDVAARAAVEAKVYRDTLPAAVDGFTQPFHLAFEELRAFLDHLETSLADVAEAGKATGDVLARLRLALPPKDHLLVTTPDDLLASLTRVYGLPFAEAGGTIAKLDAQALLGPTGVGRDELGALVATRFVTANGAVAIAIRGEKRSAESVQNDVERVEGLTRAALDRLHRFVRLWRATGWTIGELDLVLAGLAPAGGPPPLDAAAVRAVAQIHRLRERLDVPVEELAALYALLSTPLLDRLFNTPRLVQAGGVYPQPATTFLHPALASAPPAASDPHLHRLQAGTGTDEDGLYQLVVGLALPLGIDPSSPNDARKRFALTHRNLTLLHRHARLARLLRVSIPELLALCALAPELPLGHVDGLDDLEALLRFHAWWKGTRWSIADLVAVARPGTPAIATSAAPVAGTAAGALVTYAVSVDGAARPVETVTLAANATLDAAVADWNAKASGTVAYRSDPAGAPAAAGTYLSIRTRGAAGAAAGLAITADSAALFAAAPPLSVTGKDLAALAPPPAGPGVAELAAALVGEVAQGGALVFADTVFALLAPAPPVATSAAAVAGAAGGEAVTYGVVLHGVAAGPETVTLAASAGLEAVVADWNAKATLTRAYRSDASGLESPAGDRLSIRAEGGGGSDTTLTLTADGASLFTAAVPRTFTGAQVSEEQSRAILAANPAAVEPLGVEGRQRLAAAYDPDAALTLPAGVDPTLAPRLQAALRAYHAERILLARLPAAAGAAPDATARLVAMLGARLSDPVLFQELRGDVTPPAALAALIASLRRLAIVFSHAAVFDEARLAFVQANPALFGIERFDRLGAASLRRLEALRARAAGLLGSEGTPPDLHAILRAFDPVTRFAAADPAALAEALGCDVALLQSVADHVVLAPTPLEALEELARAVDLARELGVGGAFLELVQSADQGELATASAAIQAALRGRYDDEAAWTKEVETLRDGLLSRRRDGLVAWLLRSSKEPFDEVSDLYHHYLLDVQLEGCARTSRVASAIDTLQLYVQRCLMNLEESPPGAADPVHVLPQSLPAWEWSWRRSYRVWEANRKIFLFPQNWIEPELRDDKSPLFKALENDLLSKETSEQTILEAYARYLRGFDELAHLAIAGSYHEKDEAAQRDVLHLLGVTPEDPPAYYYRRVENAHFGVANPARATRWGAWEKLDAQIPVRKVSPVMHGGELYAFWTRYVTKALNQVKNGESRFVGYQHRAYVEFTKRKVDGKWTPPQKLRLARKPFDSRGDGVILDPLVPKAATVIDMWFFQMTLYSNYQPLYDDHPHEVPNDDYTLRGFMWDQVFPASATNLSIRGANFQLWSPVDLYRLEIGERTDLGDAAQARVPWLNPGIFALIWALSLGKFDLTRLLPPRLVWSRVEGGKRKVHTAPSGLPCFDTYAYAALVSDEARIRHYQKPLAASGPAQWTGPQWTEKVTDALLAVLKPDPILDAPEKAALEVVNGSVGDVIVQTSAEPFYLQHGVRSDGRYHLRRLGTSVASDIADLLFNRGLETVLATPTQLGLAEHATKLTVVPGEVEDATRTGTLDYRGAMGVYLREIFFHVPFLLANHLNSQGKHEAAQRWYHRIFDPTASETISGIDPALPEAERRRRALDRAWRYREFRGLGLDTLRAQLTDGAAIDQYRRDPFNPHAIARLRLSAYQKAIVMKYVDNLLDWGDDLFAKAFAQSNQELLREATLKYVTAQEILGPRPARLGDCGEGKVEPKTYPKIVEALVGGSEFLMEMESLVAVGQQHAWAKKPKKRLVAVSAAASTRTLSRARREVGGDAAAAGPGAELGAELAEAVARPSPEAARRAREAATPELLAAAARFTAADGVVASAAKDAGTKLSAANAFERLDAYEAEGVTSFGLSFVTEVSPVFCVPENEKLFGAWDRVEDRLYKLRNCLDPEGVFRLLPTFAPPLDPGLLARGRAAGLTLEDILSAASGDLPPYRFGYLLEKARSFASTVQGLGGALLAALEKRDAEELVRLRNVHQKNILSLTSEVRRSELKIAEEGVEMVTRRETAAQFRFDYYAGLVSTGLTTSERQQESARNDAAHLRTASATLDVLAAIMRLIPQVGSPFSMKYGGMELGSSSTSWSQVMNRVADAIDIRATLAGVVAGYERREQGWKHQQDLASHDLKLIAREKIVAELRRAIAERSLAIHERTKEQHDEVMELFEERFTGLGLYTHLSRTLQALHRQAYDDALSLARLAERAYRFERPGDETVFVGGEWDGSRSGLLAGERLLLALGRMEKRFIETNARRSELNQSFALSQLDPAALVTLKESGSCEFAIPELWLDLYYPGQYRRRVKAVRVTMPCITGPYTNVSARLTLLRSHVRREAKLGAAALVEVPRSQATSVWTSTAQGDAGVFELSFRDERCMPFEGAGVVSAWRLELPGRFRPFDYQTITDVILNVSYTAEEDEGLRAKVESASAALEGALVNQLTAGTLTRVVSLRQEFSSAFNRLVQAPAGTPVVVELGERHFPLFLRRRPLKAASGSVVLGVEGREAVGTVAMTVNGVPVTGFPAPKDPPSAADPFGGLPVKGVGNAFAAGLLRQHTIVVTDAGALAGAGGAGGPAFDVEKLRDVLLVIEYRL